MTPWRSKDVGFRKALLAAADASKGLRSVILPHYKNVFCLLRETSFVGRATEWEIQVESGNRNNYFK